MAPDGAVSSPVFLAERQVKPHDQTDSDPHLQWEEGGISCSARWHSESGLPSPRRMVLADDQMTADTAYRLACEGTALLWRGDFQNARQLLQAMTRRAGKKPVKDAASLTEAFHFNRQAQARRARTLGMLLIPFEADYVIPLRRAPDVHEACVEAWGPDDGPCVVSLRELQGLIGAHEWRRKGVEIPLLGGRIHPYYGVFSPVRGEYLTLVAEAPLPAMSLAFDIGTGTGVLAALLAKRGLARVVATDMDPRALACARANISQLGLTTCVDVVETDLFPAGKAPLIVCNPPWVPARPSSSLDAAIFDPDSRMLKGFLAGLAAHLEPAGEGWLILSDLAEHLGLRTREELLGAIAEGGLKVLGRMETRPVHNRPADKSDPLHAARSREMTSLWRLGLA